MLGRYENFPENIQSIAHLDGPVPLKSLQESLLLTFYHLNCETFDLGALTPYLTQDCEVSFEFGVADGDDFVFLDQKELEHCLKAVTEKELRVLDFFCVVRYHAAKKGNKKVPLWFDYLVLRFMFREAQTELRVRHEKGTQRVPLGELTDFVVEQLNKELYRAQLAPLVLNNRNNIHIEFIE